MPPNFIPMQAPLRGVFVAGSRPKPTFTEEQMEAARQESHQLGAEEATRRLDRQLLDQRAELVHLQSETFAALTAQAAMLDAQFQEILPALAMEALARILADTPIDREMVVRITTDLLSEVAPDNEPIEVRLTQVDLDLIAGYDAGFREKHPKIAFRADADLRPGDCVIRNRFGVIDGRLSTKLRAVEGFLK